jgi:hypothetical protein
MTNLSNLDSAAAHFSKALELYVEAWRNDRVVIAGLIRIIELATASRDCNDRELLARNLDEIAATAATSIDRRLDAGARFFEINTEIKSMRECLAPGSQDSAATPTNGDTLPP